LSRCPHRRLVLVEAYHMANRQSTDTTNPFTNRTNVIKYNQQPTTRLFVHCSRHRHLASRHYYGPRYAPFVVHQHNMVSVYATPSTASLSVFIAGVQQPSSVETFTAAHPYCHCCRPAKVMLFGRLAVAGECIVTVSLRLRSCQPSLCRWRHQANIAHWYRRYCCHLALNTTGWVIGEKETALRRRRPYVTPYGERWR